MGEIINYLGNNLEIGLWHITHIAMIIIVPGIEYQYGEYLPKISQYIFNGIL